MINWFSQQDPTVKAAIITGCAGIIVALISCIPKLLELLKAKKTDCEKKSSINITQSTTGNNNTIIGVQNNKED